MLKRLIEMLRAERRLAPEIRLQLVDGLFHPFASLIAGALAGIWIAATVTFLAEDMLVEAIADMAVVVAALRIAIGVRYLSLGRPADRSDARLWELAYAIGGGLFALLLGVLCLLAITRINDPALHLMLTTTTAGYGASITGRNAGRPLVALSQLYLSAGPMCLGLVLHPSGFYQVIGCVLFVFMFGMTDITVSVRNTIVAALETKRANAKLAASYKAQAALFDAALNNMSHGLGMFDAGGALMVWNSKLTSILGCPDTALETGMSLESFLDKLSANQNSVEARAPLINAIRHCITSGNAPQRFVKLSDAKVVAVSCQSMDNGEAVIVFEDVTEQAKAHERIEQLAWTDELTGLMNRASFKEVLAKSLEVLPAKATLALHLIDLDHFKSVNDTLGHPIGDLLLVAVSERIKRGGGFGSHIARLGGDEFVVIQRLQEGEPKPEQLAAQLISSLGETFEIAGHFINIGASIGIALAPRHGNVPDILLKRADMALYDAKAKGRNSVRVFEDEMDVHAQQRRMLELDIRAAIAERQFTLAFQPIVDLKRGAIASFETLIRWRHPTRGYV
ncbi:MAG: diguanylate cyclase, partial [Alphaproteobacteria bacterium]|nr:diguanylate cyclase [Alphaproteobacteria bacterium]